MAPIVVSRHIAASVETVFRQFTDLESSPRHVSGIKAIEMLTTGPFGLGSRWRETREVLGHLDTADMEVTAYERNRTYTITHHKIGARIAAVFMFTPEDDGTGVDIEFSLTGPGMPPGLLAPVEWAIAARVREVLSHDLSGLAAGVST